MKTIRFWMGEKKKVSSLFLFFIVAQFLMGFIYILPSYVLALFGFQF